MSFGEFVKRSRLKETVIVGSEVVGGMTMNLPFLASDEEKELTIGTLAQQLLEMAQVGDVAVTAVAFESPGELLDD